MRLLKEELRKEGSSLAKLLNDAKYKAQEVAEIELTFTIRPKQKSLVECLLRKLKRKHVWFIFILIAILAFFFAGLAGISIAAAYFILLTLVEAYLCSSKETVTDPDCEYIGDLIFC